MHISAPCRFSRLARTLGDVEKDYVPTIERPLTDCQPTVTGHWPTVDGDNDGGQRIVVRAYHSYFSHQQVVVCGISNIPPLYWFSERNYFPVSNPNDAMEMSTPRITTWEWAVQVRVPRKFHSLERSLVALTWTADLSDGVAAWISWETSTHIVCQDTEYQASKYTSRSVALLDDRTVHITT